MDITFYGGPWNGKVEWYPSEYIFSDEISLISINSKGKKSKPDEVYEVVADMALYKGSRNRYYG